MKDIVGMYIRKKDRPDVSGVVTGYDPGVNDYTVRFTRKEKNGELTYWNAEWSEYLLNFNLKEDWYLIRPSPVMNAFYDHDIQ